MRSAAEADLAPLLPSGTQGAHSDRAAAAPRKTRPGPVPGRPRTPRSAARTAEEWGAEILAAHEEAQKARGTARGPAPTPLEQARALSRVIQAAYQDGWSYGALGRATGIEQRKLRYWALALARRHAER